MKHCSAFLCSLCHSCSVPPLLFSFFFWLGYGNSLMNPIIYACSSREFQFAFRRILHCQFRRRPRVFLADHDEKSNSCYDFHQIDATTSNAGRFHSKQSGYPSKKCKSHSDKFTRAFKTSRWYSLRKCHNHSVAINMHSYDTTPSSNEVRLTESPTESLLELQHQIGVVTLEQTKWSSNRRGEIPILGRERIHSKDVFNDLTNEDTYLSCGAG
ncbi:hypothetical protein ACOMHN_005049 [Nucella lapillus]